MVVIGLVPCLFICSFFLSSLLPLSGSVRCAPGLMENTCSVRPCGVRQARWNVVVVVVEAPTY